jgi:hypothetical protein
MNGRMVRQLFTVVGILSTVTILVGCVGSGGTTVSLRTNELASPGQPFQSRVVLLNEAIDEHPGAPTIGKATWSLFRSEIGSITTDPPPKIRIIALAKKALERAGYEVRLISSHERSSNPSPVMRLRIDEFDYEMWNYTYPYVTIEGRMAITAEIHKLDGSQVDSRVFRTQTKDSCWFGGCGKEVEAAVAQNLTVIMNKLIEWTSEESFRKAIAVRS